MLPPSKSAVEAKGRYFSYWNREWAWTQAMGPAELSGVSTSLSHGAGWHVLGLVAKDPRVNGITRAPVLCPQLAPIPLE